MHLLSTTPLTETYNGLPCLHCRNGVRDKTVVRGENKSSQSTQGDNPALA